MEYSKNYWRGLFFLLLIIALCGGLVQPSVNAYAAPQRQGQTCSGGAPIKTLAQWNFDALSGANSAPAFTLKDPNVASATAASGNGLVSPTINNTSPHSNPNSWLASDFANSGTLVYANNDYFQFAVDTTNFNNVNLAFYALSSVQGSTTLEVDYSTDGTSFKVIGNAVPLNATYPTNAFTADLTNLTNTAGITYIRLYGWNSTNLTDTISIDDVVFTGCLLGTSTSTPSTPTRTSTPTSTPTLTPTATFPAGSATSVVISEFRTSGPGGSSDEYVELYNPTPNWVDISGWIISASNSSQSVQNRATIPASTILRSGQYYLVANNSYVNSYSAAADLKYGTPIDDNGGIALVKPDSSISDEVGLSANSFYQEGTPLSPLNNVNRSYERQAGDPDGSCVDTNNNVSDFSGVAPTPHNSSTIRLCNGNSGPSLSTTTTTIISDSPDPSLVNQNVTVTVRVIGGSTPTGKVNITGANTNCSITLNSSGTGSCFVKFTSTGSKALIATYLGDNTHKSSTGGASHTVATTTTIRTPTPLPTAVPPPPLIGINEFVPRPGHDWNNDGVVNVGDEYIELINHGVIDVNLSGYSLDDEANIGSEPYRLPSITLKPGERHVFFGSETGLLLSDGGDGVRLLKPNGQLGDAYNYTVVRFPDQSYCRLPDNGGLDDWNQDCFPTPGLQNSLSGTSVNPPTEGSNESLCPISDTLPDDFVLAECPPFGNNIWNPEYWDKTGWYDEKNLPESPGKWPVFAE